MTTLTVNNRDVNRWKYLGSYGDDGPDVEAGEENDYWMHNCSTWPENQDCYKGDGKQPYMVGICGDHNAKVGDDAHATCGNCNNTTCTEGRRVCAFQSAFVKGNCKGLGVANDIPADDVSFSARYASGGEETQYNTSDPTTFGGHNDNWCLGKFNRKGL